MIPPRVLLAPVDFSEPSRTALEFAVKLAHQTGAALHAALGTAVGRRGTPRRIRPRAGYRREARTLRCRRLTLSGAAPHTHVVTGPAVDAIVQTAQQVGADLIVVGSHGISGAERLVFGSTTEGVLRRAHTPVLVTPGRVASAGATAPDLSGMGPVIAALDFSTPAIEAAKAACGSRRR